MYNTVMAATPLPILESNHIVTTADVGINSTIHGNVTNETLPFPWEYFPSFIYTCCLMLIGISGNSLVCAVFHKKWKKKKKPSTLFILTLAWFDLLNCLTTLPFNIAMMLNFNHFDFPVLCKVSRWLTYYLNASSSIVLLGIAVDRLIGIRYHTKWQSFSLYRAKVVIILSIVIALVSTWPSLILYGTSRERLGDKGFRETCGMNGKGYRFYSFVYVLYLISSNVITDTLLIALYSLIGVSIRQQKTTIRRESLRHQDSARSRSLSSAGTMNRRSSSRSNNGEDGKSVPENRVKETSVNNQKKSYVESKGKLPSVDEMEDNVFEPLTIHTEKNTDERKMSDKSTTSFKRYIFKKTSSMMSSLKMYRRRSTTTSIYFSGSGRRFGPVYHTRKTTFMLFTVTLAYILTFVPFCIIAFLRLMNPSISHPSNLVAKIFYEIFLRSYIINMAINPLIYCFMNRHIRHDCMVTLKNSLAYLTKSQKPNTKSSPDHL